MYTSPKPYPYLPSGREIKYVPETNVFMARAKEVRKLLSTDFKFPTGAVVVKNGIIIGEAANQAGFKHPVLIRLHERVLCIRRALKVRSGKHYWLCPGCAPAKNHAETLAVRNAQKHGDAIGADLYLYGHWWCCEPCWNAMLGAGITDVYLVENATEMWG